MLAKGNSFRQHDFRDLAERIAAPAVPNDEDIPPSLHYSLQPHEVAAGLNLSQKADRQRLESNIKKLSDSIQATPSSSHGFCWHSTAASDFMP